MLAASVSSVPPGVRNCLERVPSPFNHLPCNLPPQFDQSKRYPLVVFPHGGPAAMSKDAFSTRWNSYLLTSPGYVLLETNYTGSTGFGEKFADDIERDLLRDEIGPDRERTE